MLSACTRLHSANLTPQSFSQAESRSRICPRKIHRIALTSFTLSMSYGSNLHKSLNQEGRVKIMKKIRKKHTQNTVPFPFFLIFFLTSLPNHHRKWNNLASQVPRPRFFVNVNSISFCPILDTAECADSGKVENLEVASDASNSFTVSLFYDVT